MSKLNPQLADALQQQMNREVLAALTYKQMRNDLRLAGWWGFHKFMHESEDEEFQHARDFDHFLSERGVRPLYSNVKVLGISYSPETPIVYFEAALRLEETFWDHMNTLYQMSESLQDPDTCKFLYKKIEQQHDSVDGLNHLVQKLKRAGSDISALQDLDSHALKIASHK